MSKCNGTYYVLVLVDENGEAAKIVGTGALVVERKLLVGFFYVRWLFRAYRG